MIQRKYGLTSLLNLWFVVSLATMVSADVSPGDVIDQTNWEKAQGLLPESVLTWVKEGDFRLDVNDLNFTVMETMPEFIREARNTNGSKLALDKDGAIVDAGTGKPPKYIIGLPFPGLDTNDPRVAEKTIHNNKYVQYMIGNIHTTAQVVWLGRSGFERKVETETLQIAMEGHPGVADLENSKRIEKYMLSVVRSPFDIAGTAVLLWRFLDPKKEDVNYGYLPAIRRTRRMDPANRSDASLGTDFAQDDLNGYDGKIPGFTWKFIRKQDAIMPWADADPARIVLNRDGAWETASNTVAYGYQKEGWQGAPWAPTNMAWAKRQAYVIEGTPKDPYYNYGTQYMWLDTETFNIGYKVIHDRAGKYWKTLVAADSVAVSEDNKAGVKLVSVSLVLIDKRTDHATVLEGASPRHKLVFGVDLDQADFTLAGFQKYCK